MVKIIVDCKEKNFLIRGDVFLEQLIEFSEWDEWGCIHDRWGGATHDWHLLFDEDGLNINIYPLIDDGDGGLEIDPAYESVPIDELILINGRALDII